MKKHISLLLSLILIFSTLLLAATWVNAASNVSASTIVNNAKSLIDQYPYVWGGESPEEGGFDCTGLVWYVYNKMSGVNISLEQAGRSKAALANAGTKIYGISNFLPGDIVQFEYAHVAIYIGDNTIIEAQKSGTRVKYRTINSYSQVAYAVRLSAVTQGGGSYTPTPTPTPTPAPAPAPAPAPTISISKSVVNLDYEGNRSETLTVSVSGTLPKEYHLNIDCDPNLNISWGEWSNRTVTLTISATKNAVTKNTATIRLRDTDGNTYATKTFSIYVTIPQEDSGLELSRTSLGIDHINNPNAAVSVYISGAFPDGGSLSVENGPAVTTDWSNYDGRNATLNITANWRLGENNEVVTVVLLDSNKNVLARQTINVYSTTPKYFVEFNANGGFNVPDDLIQYDGASCMIPYAIPERKGYEFLGWATSRYADEPDYECGDNYDEDEDVVLYAVWEEINYDFSLTFDRYITNNSTRQTLQYRINGDRDLIDEIEFDCDNNIECDYGSGRHEDGNYYLQLHFEKTGDIRDNDVLISLLDYRGNIIVQEEITVFNFNDRNTNGITVYVDGEKLEFDVQPRLINNRTMVPMRAIFEALGAMVNWDNNTQTAFGETVDDFVEISIGANYLLRNGNSKTLDSPAIVIDGRTLVPVRAIAESLNCDVEWIGDLQVVNITSLGSDYSDDMVVGTWEFIGFIDDFDDYDYVNEDFLTFKFNNNGTVKITNQTSNSTETYDYIVTKGGYIVIDLDEDDEILIGTVSPYDGELTIRSYYYSEYPEDIYWETESNSVILRKSYNHNGRNLIEDDDGYIFEKVR